MSRSGYGWDEPEDLSDWQYRNAVAAAIRGRRGQKFLCRLRDALDSMPRKRLIAGWFFKDGDCCAIAAVADDDKRRKLEAIEGMSDNGDELARIFGIAPSLAREIEYANDEQACGDPESRWRYMRRWVDQHIREEE